MPNALAEEFELMIPRRRSCEQYCLSNGHFSKECYLDRYKTVANEILNIEQKEKPFIPLGEVPLHLWKSIFEKMNQTSFTRMRRSNKSIHTYIENHREVIPINLFHNYSMRLTFVPIRNFQETKMKLYVELIPPKYSTKFPCNIVNRECYDDETWKLIFMHFHTKYPSALDFRSRPYSYDLNNNISEEEPNEYNPFKIRNASKGSLMMALEDWAMNKFFQRELTGHWHLKKVELKGFESSFLPKTMFNKGLELFLYFMRHYNILGCFVHVNPYFSMEFNRYFCKEIRATGILLEEIMPYHHIAYHNYAGDQQDLKSLYVYSNVKLEKIRSLLQQLEILTFGYAKDYQQDDGYFIAEHALSQYEQCTLFREAIQYWKRGSSMKHMSICKCTFPTTFTQYIRSINNVPYDVEFAKKVYNNYSIVRAMCDFPAIVNLFKSDNGKKIGIVMHVKSFSLAEPNYLIFHSIDVKN